MLRRFILSSLLFMCVACSSRPAQTSTPVPTNTPEGRWGVYQQNEPLPLATLSGKDFMMPNIQEGLLSGASIRLPHQWRTHDTASALFIVRRTLNVFELERCDYKAEGSVLESSIYRIGGTVHLEILDAVTEELIDQRTFDLSMPQPCPMKKPVSALDNLQWGELDYQDVDGWIIDVLQGRSTALPALSTSVPPQDAS